MRLQSDAAATLLQNIIHKPLLVIGDLMLDRFIDGVVERISPEAPVPILSNTSIQTMPGGAANVARNICQIGAKCHLIGITGRDEAAQELEDDLKKLAGLSFHPLQIANRTTTTKTRFRAGAQQIMRLDDEVKFPISSEDADNLIAIATPLIAASEIIILSDYAKGCLTDEVISRVISLAKDAGKRVIIDPKSNDFARYSGAYLVTPNLSELKAATSIAHDDDETLRATADALSKTHNIANILTTLSARGMRLDGADGSYRIASLTKDVFDVSGAGDTVVASLACALAAGEALQTAMVFANQAASIVVSKPGTAAFCAGEMLASCSSSYEAESDLDAVTAKAKRWATDGLTVGFTNGCFDLLHAGHIHILQEAAKHCDKLIIGLNSDESVKGLKGPKRPIQNQDIRAFNLSQFSFCDGVVIFDDETPLKLIEALSPDVLIKGGDYNVTEIVGYDVVTKKGGTVLTIPLLEGHSTTAFLAR